MFVLCVMEGEDPRNDGRGDERVKESLGERNNFDERRGDESRGTVDAIFGGDFQSSAFILALIAMWLWKASTEQCTC